MKKILLSLLFGLSSQAYAWEILNNWEGVFYEEGTTITYNYHTAACTPAEGQMVAEAVSYIVQELNHRTDKWTFVNGGEHPQPEWGNWYEERGDAVVTIECASPADMAGMLGMAVPIDNCLSSDPNDSTKCSNGERRFITDAGIRVLTQPNPIYQFKKTVVHEIGHTLTLGHSNIPGATMRTGEFGTELSFQLQEVFSLDDWCGLNSQMGLDEWPITTPTIDDKANLFVPYAYWLGLAWEFWFLSDGVDKWTVAQNARPVRDCSELGAP